MNENDFKSDSVTICVCTDPSYCGRKAKELGFDTGEEAIYRAIKDTRNGLGLKGKILVQRTSCQGWCDYSPVCTLWPSGKVYRGLKPAEAEKFIHEAVLEDKGSYNSRKIWNFTQSVEDNHEERRINNIKNPSAGQDGDKA
jgi:(2Fe-2S) ferredoxin